MRLASITVRNFRSIIDAYKLPLRDYAVLVGPNNEGKSNILKATVIALRLLASSQYYRAQRQLRYRYDDRELLRYDWRRDYPVALQTDHPAGSSEITLEFELSDADLSAFRKATTVNLATNLKLKLFLAHDNAKFEVQLQGKAKKVLSTKLEEVARFVGDRLEIQYIPAVRPHNMAVEVVEDLLARQLQTLENDATYRKLLADVESYQQSTLDNLAADLTKTVSSFLPEVCAIKLIPTNSLKWAARHSCS
ncbi:MAG TPA: AAA family ATPase, partial [Nitrososphaera sp.]|nr:AAA family ATPase [Nitrososphaera sp.]